ncbi:hypothetical protein BLA18112_00383 [Burkholderia lata]|uniref:Uncharacterized protein n=1 Tax=Burkholderia lata (strain ATCC 17760 / DSM 23089 / LMG 22485 / NCIMB 9086 / R18194 / 383) TaxID=482957 RepID=A0A6P2TGD6_BURL3|nr:hypothetical protein BLA18112_00383 [Burkholderia lata]
MKLKTQHYRNNVKLTDSINWKLNGLRYIIYEIISRTPPCPISLPTNPA